MISARWAGVSSRRDVFGALEFAVVAGMMTMMITMAQKLRLLCTKVTIFEFETLMSWHCT
jgi:hypothetical protein